LGVEPSLSDVELRFVKGVSSFRVGHGISINGVLVSHNHQPDSGTTLSSDHGAPGKEDFMKSVSMEVVLLNDGLLVLDEVVVPHFDGVSVMNTLVTDGLDFETTSFDLGDVPEERARSFSTREDVFTHEDSPKEVFILPSATETSDLEEEQAFGLQKGLNLRHVGLVVTDTNVLTHFEVRDFIELAVLFNSDFTVVKEQESNLRFKTFILNALVGICELFSRDSHSSSFYVEVLCDIDEP
jgi:hypothetical protein